VVPTIRIRQLPFEQDDVGLYLSEPRFLVGMLLGEARIGSGKMAFGNKIKQSFQPGAKRCLSRPKLS
jgi:hypothetical protein